jgi:putative ABC transport system permease protein
VRAAQLMEFFVLGLLAGLLAAAGASAVGWAVAEKVLQIPYRFNPVVLLLGIGAGVAAVMAAGWWGTRKSVRQPPLVTLRQVVTRDRRRGPQRRRRRESPMVGAP